MKHLLALALLPFALSAPASGPASDPAEVIRRIYRDHRPWAHEEIDLAKPEVASRYFDAPLVALFKKDADESARRGDVGCLDFDPLLQAQDFDEAGITEPVIKDLHRSGATAYAVSFTGRSPAWKSWNVHAVFDLVKTKGGWRVHDIEFPKGDSLVRTLSCWEKADAADCAGLAAKADKEGALFSPAGAYKVIGKDRRAEGRTGKVTRSLDRYCTTT